MGALATRNSQGFEKFIRSVLSRIGRELSLSYGESGRWGIVTARPTWCPLKMALNWLLPLMAWQSELLNALSSHMLPPNLPISPMGRAASQNCLCRQQGEGREAKLEWQQGYLSALRLPTIPISMQITCFVAAKLLYWKIETSCLYFKQAN